MGKTSNTRKVSKRKSSNQRRFIRQPSGHLFRFILTSLRNKKYPKNLQWVKEPETFRLYHRSRSNELWKKDKIKLNQIYIDYAIAGGIDPNREMKILKHNLVLALEARCQANKVVRLPEKEAHWRVYKLLKKPEELLSPESIEVQRLTTVAQANSRAPNNNLLDKDKVPVNISKALPSFSVFGATNTETSLNDQPEFSSHTDLKRKDIDPESSTPIQSEEKFYFLSNQEMRSPCHSYNSSQILQKQKYSIGYEENVNFFSDQRITPSPGQSFFESSDQTKPQYLKNSIGFEDGFDYISNQGITLSPSQFF